MAEFGPDPALLPIIKDAPLIGYTSRQQLTGSELWREKPCVIMVVRRPGCNLCRAQAKQLADIRSQLNEMGVGLAAVSLQEDSAQDFVNLYFGKADGQQDSLYIDSSKAFYKALGHGKLRTKGLLGLLSTKFWSNNSEANSMGTKGNLSGDYSHLGGVLLVGKGDAGVLWSFQEVEFGDKAPIQSLLKACRQSVGKE